MGYRRDGLFDPLCRDKGYPERYSSGGGKIFIENIVLRHGAPTVVITDRGTAFTAALLDHVLMLSGTTHRKTTAYHSQTNGLTERLNKTIEDMLSMYVDVEHKNWDTILPYITFAYNTAKQETTRMTPFSLVHGREVRTMLDAMLPHEGDDIVPDADTFTERAEEARQLARLRISQQQDYDAGRYNAHRRTVVYQTGDKVWVWTPIRKRGLSEKLLRRYFGPYLVVRRRSDVTYDVVPDCSYSTRRRQHHPELVHVVRMKPYISE
uniref:Putative polyprotein n=1 Tax=Rhipicephalus microplus TaxID=6941 RepID=A0A6G5ABD6_RHIMP